MGDYLCVFLVLSPLSVTPRFVVFSCAGLLFTFLLHLPFSLLLRAAPRGLLTTCRDKPKDSDSICVSLPSYAEVPGLAVILRK